MKTSDIIKRAARELRKNMTEAESVLWEELRNDKLGYRFLRQKPLHVYTESNSFDRFIIVDFFCKKRKLIIEVDGNIHNKEEIYVLDRHKEELLYSNDYSIIRIQNKDIFENVDKCIERIQSRL
jgi:very-short-patch-repair endonuclease